MSKYTVIEKRYLAESLSFLGFHYIKYQNDENKTLYRFDNTELFNEALHKILELRKQLELKKEKL